MSTSKIATSTLWQLSSQAVTMVVGFLGIKFVTIGLSQKLVGNYQTVYSFLQIFGILADFGLYAISVRELAKSANPLKTFSSLFALRACVTILSLGSAIGLVWGLPSFTGTPLPLGVTVAAFVPFFVLLSGMLRTLFQVEYQMQYVFGAEIVGKVVPVCLMGAVLSLGVRETVDIAYYYLFLTFGVVGSFILFLISLFFVQPFIPIISAVPRGLSGVCQRFAQVYQSFSKEEFLHLFRLSAPFGIAFLLTTVYRQSDVTLIALLRPDYELQNAYYGIVLRIAEVGFLLPTFILNSMLPLVHAHKNKGEFLGKILLTLLTLGSVIALTAFFWARPIVLLLTRDTYLSTALVPGSDTALQLVSFSIFLGMIVSFCFYVLLIRHWWKRLIACTGVAALLSLSMNSMLIPLYGFVGAGITSICVHAVLALLLVCFTIGLPRFSQHADAVYLRFSHFARWGVFTLLFALFLVWSAPFLSTPLWTLLGGLIAVGIAALLTVVCGVIPWGYIRR